MNRFVLLGLILFVASSPAGAEPLRAHAVADLIGLDGKPVGHADFAQTSHGILIELDLHGLPPGPHGVHVHGSGVCEPRKRFTSAGPHFALEPRAHGYFARGGPHEGDLPNQFSASDGSLHASMLTNAFTLGNGEKSIFTRSGASIIVDSRPDDYFSQPDGHAGDRIACGVIMRTVAPGSRKAATHAVHK